MGDGKLEEPPELYNPEDLCQDAFRLGDVHEAHEGRREVEARLAERKIDGARELVVDAEGPHDFGLSGVADESLGDVDPGHAGTTLREQPGVVSFPAADIETGKAIDIWEHLEEGRGVQAVALVVVAGTHQLR